MNPSDKLQNNFVCTFCHVLVKRNKINLLFQREIKIKKYLANQYFIGEREMKDKPLTKM